jgi:hypothetical protein
MNLAESKRHSDWTVYCNWNYYKYIFPSESWVPLILSIYSINFGNQFSIIFTTVTKNFHTKYFFSECSEDKNKKSLMSLKYANILLYNFASVSLLKISWRNKLRFKKKFKKAWERFGHNKNFR